MDVRVREGGLPRPEETGNYLDRESGVCSRQIGGFPEPDRAIRGRVETMWPNDYGPEWNRTNYNDPTPNYPDSDESDSDEMLPLGAFWPTPEEEKWTIVGKPHSVQRYDKCIYG